MKKVLMIALAAVCFAGGLQAQNPLASDTRFWYTAIKGFVIRAAQKMPEENYSFRPVDTVRTFRPDCRPHRRRSSTLFCSTVKGESKPTEIEKTVTSKADLIDNLKQAFSYCDAVYDSFTDAHAADKVKTFAGERTKLSILSFNYAHAYEHYGNIVTYMRIKGLVPPSSETGSK